MSRDPDPERRSPVARPAPLLLALVLTCVAMGGLIYWLIRSMRL